MPIIGIDLGCLNTTVATVGKGGVTICRSDLAERVTPTLVSFTENERLIGDAALTSLKSNAKGTIRNVKHLLGASAEDSRLIALEQPCELARIVELPNRTVAFDVGRAELVTPVEALIPFLKKMKQMSENYIGAPVTNCVVAVPSWFSDVHRSAVVDACEIAKMPCHKVMHHSSATALDYGLFRSSMIAADQDHIVLFVDIGYGQATATVVSFKSNELVILATCEDPGLGGRVVDDVLSKYLLQEFRNNSGLDPTNNVKAMMKIAEAAEKTKKVLSANSEYRVHLECFMGEEDLDVTVTREAFETLIGDYIGAIIKLLHLALTVAKIDNIDKLASVEIVGGCTRIPAIHKRISKEIKPVSRTLSADECVARGAAVQAAMLDPRHRVREFNLREIRQDGVVITFSADVGTITDEKNKAVQMIGNEYVIYSEGCGFSRVASRILNIPNQSPQTTSFNFTVANLRSNQRRRVVDCHVELPPEARKALTENPTKCRLRLKVNLDVHCIIRVEATFHHEVVKQETVIERQPKRDEKGEIIDGEYDEIKMTKPKSTISTYHLQIIENRAMGFLNAGDRLRIQKREEELEAQDLATQRARAIRNDILTQCFKVRAAVQDPESRYAPFVTIESRQQVLDVSRQCELFVEENEDLSVDIYQPYSNMLQNVWSPIEQQYQDWFRSEEEKRVAAEAEASRIAAAAETDRLSKEVNNASAMEENSMTGDQNTEECTPPSFEPTDEV